MEKKRSTYSRIFGRSSSSKSRGSSSSVNLAAEKAADEETTEARLAREAREAAEEERSWKETEAMAKELVAERDSTTSSALNVAASAAKTAEDRQRKIDSDASTAHDAGMQASSRGDYLEAKSCFLKAHQLQPIHPPHLISAANMAYKHGDFDAAVGLW